MNLNVKHKISTYFSLFMGLYMLNISVDVPNYIFNSSEPDTSFNLQESIIEIFIEKVLGFDDAIPENRDNDTDSKCRIKPSFKVDLFLHLQELKMKNSEVVKQHQHYTHYKIPEVKAPFSEVTSPPPDFS